MRISDRTTFLDSVFPALRVPFKMILCIMEKGSITLNLNQNKTRRQTAFFIFLQRPLRIRLEKESKTC